MTRKERRAKVVARERWIKQKLAEGSTHPEVADLLGVSVQRIYNFLHEAKNRPKLIVTRLARVTNTMADDRRLARIRVHTAPGKKSPALGLLAELKDLLERSEYESQTAPVTGAVVVLISKTRLQSRPRIGVDRILSKVRAAALASKKMCLTRLRVHGKERIKRQTWVFTFR